MWPAGETDSDCQPRLELRAAQGIGPQKNYPPLR
jgi:hypothetical protein